MLSDKIVALKLPSPLCVASGSSVRQVIETVRQHRDDAVIICDGKRPVGIMTERDVLMKVVARDVKRDEPVDRFMTPTTRTLTPGDAIGEAIAVMTEEGVQNVTIVDENGMPIALLRVRDVIDHLAESFPQHVVNLPPRPDQDFKTAEGA